MSQPEKNPEPQRSFPGDPEQEESPPQGQDEPSFHAQEHSSCSVGHKLVTGVSMQTQHSALHIILTTLSKKPPVEEFRGIRPQPANAPDPGTPPAHGANSLHSDPSLPPGKYRHSPGTEELTEALHNSFTHPQTPRGLKSLLKFLPATRKGSERQTPTCLLGCISASSQAAAGAGRRACPRRSERETICFHRKQTSLIFQSRQALPPRSPFGSSRARTRPCCGAFLQEELEQPWCSAWYPRRTPLRAVTPFIVISAHSALPGDHPHQAGRQEKGTGNSPKSQHHLSAKRGWCQRDPLLQAASWKSPVNGHSAAHPLKTTGRISSKTRAILRI